MVYCCVSQSALSALFAAAPAFLKSGLFEQANLKKHARHAYPEATLDYSPTVRLLSVFLSPLHVVVDESSLRQSGLEALPTETSAADSTVPTPPHRYATPHAAVTVQRRANDISDASNSSRSYNSQILEFAVM